MSVSCMSCARVGTSCCKGYQIYLTTGDVQRIAAFLGRQDFFATEIPVLSDIEPEHDALWMPMILKSDGKVRVLKRTPEKKCELLTENGCILPFDSRPLLCRLHPYIYTETGITGIDQTCPISGEKNWTTVLDHMGMPAEKAIKWCTLLYSEVRKELV